MASLETRLLLIDDSSNTIISPGKYPSSPPTFPSSVDGLAWFRDFLAEHPPGIWHIVIDSQHELHIRESLPALDTLRGKDRSALATQRLRYYFGDVPFKTACIADSGIAGNQPSSLPNLLLAALTNDAWLQDCLATLEQSHQIVSGVTSNTLSPWSKLARPEASTQPGSPPVLPIAILQPRCSGWRLSLCLQSTGLGARLRRQSPWLLQTQLIEEGVTHIAIVQEIHNQLASLPMLAFSAEVTIRVFAPLSLKQAIQQPQNIPGPAMPFNLRWQPLPGSTAAPASFFLPRQQRTGHITEQMDGQFLHPAKLTDWLTIQRHRKINQLSLAITLTALLSALWLMIQNHQLDQEHRQTQTTITAITSKPIATDTLAPTQVARIREQLRRIDSRAGDGLAYQQTLLALSHVLEEHPTIMLKQLVLRNEATEAANGLTAFNRTLQLTAIIQSASLATAEKEATAFVGKLQIHPAWRISASKLPLQHATESTVVRNSRDDLLQHPALSPAKLSLTLEIQANPHSFPTSQSAMETSR